MWELVSNLGASLAIVILVALHIVIILGILKAFTREDK